LRRLVQRGRLGRVRYQNHTQGRPESSPGRPI
jgi:hypothetical protein